MGSARSGASRILVPLVGRALQRILSEHHVTVESDPHRAVDRLIADDTFDLILCDLHLPQFRGEGLLKAVTRGGRPTPARFVYMTGGAYLPGDQTVLESAPGGYVMKPFDPDEIRAFVDAALRRCA